MKILFVESSPTGEKSQTRRLARRLKERIQKIHPLAEIVQRDVAQTHIPHLDLPAVEALKMGAAGAAHESFLALSDRLIGELLSSDVIVIALPMWNFSIPSSLKAWLDHILRAGKTFSYSPDGPRGLLSGKRAILIASSGGVYSEGARKSADFAEPYMRMVLGFIGIEQVQTVRVEGLAIPTLTAGAIEAAEKAVDALTI